MSNMAKRYDDEFRREAVRLVVEEGIRKAQVCRDLGVSEASLYKWLSKTKTNVETKEGELSESEREELTRLRRENSQLKQERDILKKATAYFAKESK